MVSAPRYGVQRKIAAGRHESKGFFTPKRPPQGTGARSSQPSASDVFTVPSQERWPHMHGDAMFWVTCSRHPSQQ
jgi:hypothetical protein